MLASTHLDPVIGLDIHWEMVPMPAPVPTPLPNPFVGMVWDPMGLGVGLLITQVVNQLTGSPPTGAVTVSMLPVTNTGTEATGFGHILIPPGTSWAPMPDVLPVVIPKDPPDGPGNPAAPDDDAVVVTGSKTVMVMGANFCRLGDMAMSCAEPVRLPSSVVMAIPKGPPVLIGGPPTLDFMAAAGAFIRTQWLSHQLNNALSYLRSARLRSLLSRAVCFLTGHPVDVATGRVFTDHVDFELPGPIPLRFERVYNSGFADRPGPLGHGWSHSLDQKIWEERGKVVYLADDGRELEFDAFHLPDHRMRAGDELYHPIDRLTLKCFGEGRWEIWTADGIGHEFGPVEGGEPHVARLLAKKSRDAHNRIELHYDERARLSWVRDSGKRQIRFVHDDAGRLVSVKLPVARGEGHFEHTRYAYDAHGDLVQVTDPAGNFWEFEYGSHLLTRETDRERLSFYFGYDGIGQDAWCVRTWGDGGIYDHQLTYDKESKVTCVTNSLGHTTTYRMDLIGTVVEIIDPHGASTKYEYDPQSLQRTAEIDELGNATRFAYDERGNRVRVEGPDGAITTLEPHPRFDSPMGAVDPNGGEWKWDYDDFGRLRGRANPFGHWTRYEYEEGRLVHVTTPGQAVTALSYDAAGNVARVVSASGGETRFEYDRLGRPIKVTSPRGGVERRQYDSVGNLVEVEEPHVRRRFTYDKEQNLTRAADPLRDVGFTYAGYHRLHERHEAGTTIRFHYDTEDQLESVENEAGEHYRFELDARGLVQVETGFDEFARRYTRDAAGRVLRVDKASGRSDELSYDAAGRITAVAHSDGSFERYAYRADGALIEASNDAAEVHFDRDPLGRVVRELTRLPEGSEQWVRSGYGPDGHRVRVESSDGHLHHIERNSAGDVTRVELEARRWHVDFERDPVGLELSRTFPSGVSSRWQRDAVGRPTRRTVTHGGERTLDDKTYQWEGDDQIRAILDPQQGDAHYKHDPRGRLVWAKLPWGEEQHRAMDAVGNIYRSPDLSDRRYGKGGRIEEADGTAYRHDDDGNLVEKSDVLGATTRYRWNGAGMLEAVELPHGREVSFTYDVLARRLGKVVGVREGEELRTTKEVRWAWDGHNPLTELDSEEGKSTWVFEPETFNPLAKLAEGKVWGVLTDQIGTPTELIAQDGGLDWSAHVDLYGEQVLSLGDAPVGFGWPGQQLDSETMLHYNRFRFYDPVQGGYIRQDPLNIYGGLRAYGYVGDPLGWLDPFGLSGTCRTRRRQLRRIQDMASTAGDSGVAFAVDRRNARRLADMFLGDGATLLGRGRQGELWMESADRLRMVRMPANKGSAYARTGVQANFHQRPNSGVNWFDQGSASNVHVHVSD